MCDDDVLGSDGVVESVRAFAADRAFPAVIVATVIKNGQQLPTCAPEGPPQCGHVDLTSFIVRADVWQAHVHDYGKRYEGDFDHAEALWTAGHRFAFCSVLWAIGGAGYAGQPAKVIHHHELLANIFRDYPDQRGRIAAVLESYDFRRIWPT